MRQDEELVRQRIRYLVERGGFVPDDHPAIAKSHRETAIRIGLIVAGATVGIVAWEWFMQG